MHANEGYPVERPEPEIEFLATIHAKNNINRQANPGINKEADWIEFTKLSRYRWPMILHWMTLNFLGMTLTSCC